MRNKYKFPILGILFYFMSACSQTVPVQPKVTVQKSEPKWQIIHLYDFKRNEVSSFALGMLDSACIKLDTVRTDSAMTVMKCMLSPEKKVFAELGRVLLRYKIKADYRVSEGIIEVHETDHRTVE